LYVDKLSNFDTINNYNYTRLDVSTHFSLETCQCLSSAIVNLSRLIVARSQINRTIVNLWVEQCLGLINGATKVATMNSVSAVAVFGILALAEPPVQHVSILVVFRI